MLPTNTPSSTPVLGTFFPPDDIPHTIPLEDYEQGGIALQNVTAGLMARTWKGWVAEGGFIRIAPVDDLANYFQVTQADGITDLAISFDQAMRPVVAYQVGTSAYLRWYNPLTISYVTQEFPLVQSPRLTLDDKRATSSLSSDVLFFYIRSGGTICFRRQRDRYLDEYVYLSAPGAASIYRLGMTNKMRVQLDYLMG